MKIKQIKRLNKKGQVESIIIFFFLLIAILITSIIVLRITNAILTPFQQRIGNLSITGAEQSADVIYKVQTNFNKVWDWVIILLFAFNILVLFITSFLIDIHPAFAIIYIIAVIFLFVFGNSMLYVLDSIWNNSNIATDYELQNTQMQQFLINNFQLILLGIFFVSGVIIYAKIKYFGSGNSSVGGNY